MTQNSLAKEFRGRVAFLAGLSAEESALRTYCARGYQCLAERWRGQAGEIDLVLKLDDVFVFVEVKKSRSFSAAALRVSPRQKARIFAAAEEFVGAEPEGLLSQMRFDLALVDSVGHVEIIESALFDG